MIPSAKIIQISLVLQYFSVTSVSPAIVGDGTRSLYSGQLIAVDSDRGACLVEDTTYKSETAVPRDHPCHYCICYEGQISCYWKSCGPAPVGCSVMFFEDTCNPSLYKCTVPKMSMAEPKFGTRIKPLRKSRFRRETISGDTSKTLPVQENFPVEINEAFLAKVEGNRVRRAVNSSVFWQPRDKSCTILGVKYNLGEVVGVASDPCLECRCAAGDMFCSPRCCFNPAPLNPNRLEIQQHEQMVLHLVSSQPPPHPLENIRNQIMPFNSL